MRRGLAIRTRLAIVSATLAVGVLAAGLLTVYLIDRRQVDQSLATSARRAAGETVAFGPRLVHDVHNVEGAPAVSLHVYSPPLAAMTYYDVAADGLTARHTEPVDVRPSDGPLPERAAPVEV